MQSEEISFSDTPRILCDAFYLEVAITKGRNVVRRINCECKEKMARREKVEYERRFDNCDSKAKDKRIRRSFLYVTISRF